MSNAAGYEIIFDDNTNGSNPPSCFDTLDEAKRFAEGRGLPCKIWAYGPNDGWNNWQKLVVIYENS